MLVSNFIRYETLSTLTTLQVPKPLLTMFLLVHQSCITFMLYVLFSPILPILSPSILSIHCSYSHFWIRRQSDFSLSPEIPRSTFYPQIPRFCSEWRHLFVSHLYDDTVSHLPLL